MTGSQAPVRLPKGPHDLSREQVEASQRQRLLDAVLDIVGEHGYAAATVARVTAAAGVSRTTFYEQFRNKQDAFLAAYDQFAERFLADMAEVTGATPADTLAAAADRLVRWGSARPHAARAFLLEIHAVGEEGLERRDRVMHLAEGRFQAAAAALRDLDPSLVAPPRLVGRGVVAASWELAAQGVRTRRDTSADTREALTYIWLLGLTGRPAGP
ncbi:MAG: TetR family transcriptional regulator [Solirubrobacterales bacterium]|nr:TetR family transcriptional regulator [Solirubrobacterales bacterium]